MGREGEGRGRKGGTEGGEGRGEEGRLTSREEVEAVRINCQACDSVHVCSHGVYYTACRWEEGLTILYNCVGTHVCTAKATRHTYFKPHNLLVHSSRNIQLCTSPQR